MAVSIQASHLFTSHLYKTNPSLQTRLNDTADWCNEAGAEDRNKEPNQSVLLPRSTHQMSKIGNGLNLFLVFTRTCVSAPGLKREKMNSCFFSFFFFFKEWVHSLQRKTYQCNAWMRQCQFFFGFVRSTNGLDCVKKSLFSQLWEQKNTEDFIQRCTGASKRPPSRVVEAIHLVSIPSLFQRGKLHITPALQWDIFSVT